MRTLTTDSIRDALFRGAVTTALGGRAPQRVRRVALTQLRDRQRAPFTVETYGAQVGRLVADMMRNRMLETGGGSEC